MDIANYVQIDGEALMIKGIK